ncbi:hypothetical protein ACOSQ3_019166 [Xanthoceras sorbifolium]
MPTTVLHGQTPYKCLFGYDPDYSSLKVFDCLVYPYLRPYNKHKFQLRSSLCTFIGYSSQYKGYKYLSATGRVYITRHAVFEENIFPFTQPLQSSDGVSKGPELFPSLYPPLVQGSTTGSNRVTVPNSSPTSGFDPTAVVQHYSSTSGFDPVPTQNSFSADFAFSNTSTHVPSASFGGSISPTTTVVPTASTAVPTAPPATMDSLNTHPMVTRSKSGIFKPKVLLAEGSSSEPTTASQALKDPKWAAAMAEEY